MKKIILFGTILFTSCFALAQQKKSSTGTRKSDITFGVKVGSTISNFLLSNGGPNQFSTTSLGSLFVGGIVDIPIYRTIDQLFTKTFEVSLQPGLMLIPKGGDVNVTNASSNPLVSTKLTPIYIEVPVNIVAKFHMGPPTGMLLVGAGPYVSFGIAGAYKQTYPTGSTTANTNQAIAYGSYNNGDINRLDFGLDFLVGYQLGNFSINGGYDLGLSSIQSTYLESAQITSIKNSTFTIGFGYFF